MDDSGRNRTYGVLAYGPQPRSSKYVVVIPQRELVVVYLNHAEFPDNALTMSPAELKALPTISKSQMSHLLQLLVEAQRRTN